MGKSQRDKGARNERGIVNELKERGIPAERVPLSGAAGGSCKGDIWIPIQGARKTFEAKKRGDGFALLYRWLGENDGLFVGADRKETLVVLRLEDFAALIGETAA